MKTGDVLVIDTGTRFDGYFSDFDRNYAFGTPGTTGITREEPKLGLSRLLCLQTRTPVWRTGLSGMQQRRASEQLSQEKGLATSLKPWSEVSNKPGRPGYSLLEYLPTEAKYNSFSHLLVMTVEAMLVVWVMASEHSLQSGQVWYEVRSISAPPPHPTPISYVNLDFRWR